ncbi:Adenosylmethionine-8-amino-7-oxononanoate aminotransferase [bacterium HR12]|nr:Adenosylmethionine-8-amino-7-oxononanoate aminotransferase [bacterium HR12]
MPGTVTADATHVFPRFLDLAYPNVERGEGVWLTTVDGRRILDACSGGAMVTCLGHSVPELAAAAAEQAERISYFYNHHFTNGPQERLAERLTELVAPGMARVRFVSGGSEAVETMVQLARLYHVERGEVERWRVVSPAQAYHGSTMGTLALTGRRALQEPYTPYLADHRHIPPPGRGPDPTGERALAALDRILEEEGSSVAAFVCEPVGAAALPGHAPPDRFWEGLAERRERYGFLVCFDEVVTGIGRVGTWLAADQVPIEPDIVAVGKALGAGHAPLGAVLCREHVYEAVDRGSREFDLGHTWDGAPLSCAVGLRVLDLLVEGDLVARVRERGPRLLEELREALAGLEIVREVRGRGYLLGFELVDPRDGESFLPVELDAGALVDDTALEHGLLVTSTHPQADGYAGDQTVFAPAYTSTDEELAEMLERLRATMEDVERRLKERLARGRG